MRDPRPVDPLRQPARRSPVIPVIEEPDAFAARLREVLDGSD
jgi:hypothetical protein